MVPVKHAEGILRVGITFIRCSLQVRFRLRRVRHHVLVTQKIEFAQKGLGFGVSLLCGLFEPSEAFVGRWLQFFTLAQKDTQAEHRLAAAFFGGLSIPVHGGLFISLDALAFGQEKSQAFHRLNMTVFGGFLDPLQSLLGIFVQPAPVVVSSAQFQLGRGITR